MGCLIILGRNLKFPAVLHSCRNNPSDMISDKGALIFYNLVTKCLQMTVQIYLKR